MSKKTNNNQHLKQRIREQQAEIDSLKRHSKDLHNIIRTMRENKFAIWAHDEIKSKCILRYLAAICFDEYCACN